MGASALQVICLAVDILRVRPGENDLPEAPQRFGAVELVIVHVTGLSPDSASDQEMDEHDANTQHRCVLHACCAEWSLAVRNSRKSAKFLRSGLQHAEGSE